MLLNISRIAQLLLPLLSIIIILISGFIIAIDELQIRSKYFIAIELATIVFIVALHNAFLFYRIFKQANSQHIKITLVIRFAFFTALLSALLIYLEVGMYLALLMLPALYIFWLIKTQSLTALKYNIQIQSALVLIASFFYLTTQAIEPSVRFIPHEKLIFAKQDGSEKVVTLDFDDNSYLIPNQYDFGFFRYAIKFSGILSDGQWKKFDDGQLSSFINVDKGEVQVLLDQPIMLVNPLDATESNNLIDLADSQQESNNNGDNNHQEYNDDHQEHYEDDQDYDYHDDEDEGVLEELTSNQIVRIWLDQITNNYPFKAFVTDQQVFNFDWVNFAFAQSMEYAAYFFPCGHCKIQPQTLEQILSAWAQVDMLTHVNDAWLYDKNGQSKFKLINPDFVKTINDKFTIDQETEILDYRLDFLYNSLLRSYFRAALQSYLVLQSHPNRATAIKDYKSFIDIENTPGADFYWNFASKRYLTPDKLAQSNVPTFININSQIYETYSISRMTLFWIRRQIDGSDENFYQLVVRFVQTFDAQWLAQQQNISVHDISFVAGEAKKDK